MVSSIAIAAAEGVELEEKPRLVDEIAANSQRESEPVAPAKKKRGGAYIRQRTGALTHAPRGPPDDRLEELIGEQLIYSVNDLAKLANKSPATIFRMLRLRRLPFVWVGEYRCFTRAIVLDFLRNGTRESAAA